MASFTYALKVALFRGILMGWGCHVWVQGGNIDMAVKTLQEGFKLESGNAMVDELFNRGGNVFMELKDLNEDFSFTLALFGRAGSGR